MVSLPSPRKQAQVGIADICSPTAGADGQMLPKKLRRNSWSSAKTNARQEAKDHCREKASLIFFRKWPASGLAVLV